VWLRTDADQSTSASWAVAAIDKHDCVLRAPCSAESRSLIMLTYAVVFLIIALIAGALGFGVVAGLAATFAKLLFVVFLALFVLSLVALRQKSV
jgi:uncharacterized membrane protein YtjA (UPF0391 family)